MEYEKCPSCGEKSLAKIPIGLTPTKEKHGNLYSNTVCYNTDCNYRELSFMETIAPSGKEE